MSLAQDCYHFSGPICINRDNRFVIYPGISLFFLNYIFVLTHLSQLFLTCLSFILKMIASTPAYGQNLPTFSQEIANLVKKITHGASLMVNLVMEVLPVVVTENLKMVAYHQ